MNLITPSCVLRKWSDTDIPSLILHANHPEVAKWMRNGFPSPYTQKDAEHFIEMTTGDNCNIILAIDIRGEAVGGIGVHQLNDIYQKTVFATVSLPISSWWGGSYEIRRSRFEEMKAENNRLNIEQNLAVDIESKWNNLQESYLQTEIAKKSIESATENLKISKDYFDAGTIALTDMLNARTQLQKSRDQYTDACTTYYLKLSAYLKATGR